MPQKTAAINRSSASIDPVLLRRLKLTAVGSGTTVKALVHRFVSEGLDNLESKAA